jgi:hypothetical protein
MICQRQRNVLCHHCHKAKSIISFQSPNLLKLWEFVSLGTMVGDLCRVFRWKIAAIAAGFQHPAFNHQVCLNPGHPFVSNERYL